MIGRCAGAWLPGAVLATTMVAVMPVPGAAAAGLVTAVGPVPPASPVLFFVHESDVRKVPAPGVVVTVTVSPTARDGSAVAPAQRSGAATGSAAATARSATDNLGNAYFQLRAGRPSGTDTFAWSDDHGHGGEVDVAVAAAATPVAAPVVASAAAGPASPEATAAQAPMAAPVTPPAPLATDTPSLPWRPAVTALAAAAVAAVLLFALPRTLRRRASRRAVGTRGGG